MIKIKLKMEPKDRTDIFLPSDSLEKVLQRFGIREDAQNYLLDGTRIAETDIEKELREIGLRDSALLKRQEKKENPAEEEKTKLAEDGNIQVRPDPMPSLFSEAEENMPEIVICGTTAALFSGILLETWKEILSTHPELGLYEESGDPLFKVAVEEGPGSLNENGAVFSTIPSGKGYACVTLILDPTEPDKQGMVLDTVGKAMQRLTRLENSLRGLSDEKMADLTVTSRIRVL